MVGPFIYFDHLGPELLRAGEAIDVPPHPHIHLATVTYLFEGSLVHRDSLGSVATIRPGDINWMHAGRGIVHSERSDARSRARESTIHGVQLWVALPRDVEDTEPEFAHYPKASLPSWKHEGIQGRLLVGRVFDHESPVRTRCPTLCLDLRMNTGSTVRVPGQAGGLCAYVVSGALGAASLDAGPFGAVVFGPGTDASLTASAPSRVLVIGGDPVDGERHIWWNFVSSSRRRIEEAARDWVEGRFPRVPGDYGEPMAAPAAQSEAGAGV